MCSAMCYYLQTCKTEGQLINMGTEINSDYYFQHIHKITTFQLACLPGSGSAHFGRQLSSVMKCFDLKCKCFFLEVSEIQLGRLIYSCPLPLQPGYGGWKPLHTGLLFAAASMSRGVWSRILAWLFLPEKKRSLVAEHKRSFIKCRLHEITFFAGTTISPSLL